MAVDGTNPWIRRFHSATADAPRLVCLPHAGGSAGFFTRLSAALSPAVDVLAVQYPGRQDRRAEPVPVNLQRLADLTYDALGAFADRPLALFGHSMGATLAFEVALRLENKGVTVPHLFASGRRAPSRYRDENVHLGDDEALVRELRLLGGSEPRLLDDPGMRALVLPYVRSDFTAIETYRHRPGTVLRAPVTVFTGDDDPKTSLEEAWAWSEHTTGTSGLHLLPGGHFFLIDHADEIHAVLAGLLSPRAAAVAEQRS